MTIPLAGGARRLRLMAEAQGRPLDEAYLHQSIRADFEAEAAEPDPDALLTPGMLGHLRELMAEKAAMESGEERESFGPNSFSSAAAGPELFCSTDAVVIVPGFLSSALGDSGDRGLGLIWLSPAALASNLLGALQLGPYDGKEADLDPQVRVVPTGPLPIFYDLLRLALEVRRYTTEIFAVDWRKDMELAARRLASRLRVLGSGARPVHLVAHSQGALVARRAVQLLGPVEAGSIVRNLVLLGPANFGSFSAALALGGGHRLLSLARKLAVEPPQGFQQVLASMTGLYQLLPWDDSRVPWLRGNSLGRSRFWRGGADFTRLDKFHGWGRGIDASFLDGRTALILGDNHGSPTVGAVAYEGMTLREEPGHGLAGDGTVPHSCAVLPGVRTYLAAGTEHSMLATSRGVIDAVLDLLAGRPVRLPEIPSDPAAHLEPSEEVGALLAFGPSVSSPSHGHELDPVVAPYSRAPRDLAPGIGGLNGSFLTSYDARQAVPEQAAALPLQRRAQLRDERHRTELQVSSAGRDALLPSFELILDASNLLPFDFLRTGDRLGRAVLKLQRADGSAGTGFLVAPGILLTNHHVLPDVATAASAKAVANYEATPPDDPSGRAASAALSPKELFLTNADLDFTFCAVGGLDYLGVVALNRNSMNIMRSEYVNIIQHPRGRPKEIVLQDNRVVRADNVILQYSCDTEPGSSGSPVFNNQWKLVALHHASVVVNGEGGRHAPDADPSARYLNEGIRLSAIATWLETAEANSPDRREVVARLRGIFRGLDPQTGFFGALGRKAHGRGAAEVVVEAYRGGADDLDVAFWDLRGFARVFRDRLVEIARVVAEMKMDVWCVAHPGAETVRALVDSLETNFQLEYAALIDPEGAHMGVAIIYRRDKSLTITRLRREEDGVWGVAARLATRRGATVDFHVVPVFGRAAASALFQAIGRRIAPGARSAPDPDPEADWLLMGEADALRQPARDLAATGQEVLALVSEPDGAIVLLSGAGSSVDFAVASPNLVPTLGGEGLLVIAGDREFPKGVESLGGPHPVALRLAVNGPRERSPAQVQTQAPPQGVPAPPAHAGEPATPLASPPQTASHAPNDIDDDILERKLKALLGPLLAQLLAARGTAVDG